MSEPVNGVSWQAEVFWRRLLNRVDDFGRYTANPALLRASVFPLQLDKVREADISRLLAECEKAGLLFVYAAKPGKPTLVINKWEKGRASTSDYDAPPADICERMQTFVYRCKRTHANAPDSDSDTDANSDTDTDAVADLLMVRVGALFNRRAKTPWSASEKKAWKTAQAIAADTSTDSWALLEWWFSLEADKAPYRRTDLAALLNNWHAEIEKARRNKATAPVESRFEKLF